MRSPILTATAAAFLIILGTTPAAAQRPEVVGCWTLEMGAWDPPLEGNDPGFPPPPQFELRGRRGGGEGPAIYGGPWTWDQRERHWKWSRLRDGGVAIVFGTGFAGYHLRLQPREDRLEGTIEAFTDGLGRRRPHAPAIARRGCRK